MHELTLLSAIILLNACCQEVHSESAIQRLRKDLLRGYDPYSRPVHDHEKVTDIVLDIMPVHITDVNENNGILTMECWLIVKWTDDHLKWDPVGYSDINEIRLSDADIWKPDLSVYNGRGKHTFPWNSVNPIVFSGGTVLWIPPASLQFICGNFDYTDFPQDTQICDLNFGSWSGDVKSLNFTLAQEQVTFHSYQSGGNPHWELVSMMGVRRENEYDCVTSQCEGDLYMGVGYRMKIQRTHVPFSALCSTPDIVARLLILFMFWIASGIGKLLVGCTSLLILSAISVGVTVTLPSPAAATAALKHVTFALALGVAALIVQLVVIGISRLSYPAPAYLERASTSLVGRFLVPCHPDEFKEALVEENIQQRKKNHWITLSVFIDIFMFVVFAVLLTM